MKSLFVRDLQTGEYIRKRALFLHEIALILSQETYSDIIREDSLYFSTFKGFHPPVVLREELPLVFIT
jgi:hypothetical protein